MRVAVLADIAVADISLGEVYDQVAHQRSRQTRERGVPLRGRAHSRSR